MDVEHIFSCRWNNADLFNINKLKAHFTRTKQVYTANYASNFYSPNKSTSIMKSTPVTYSNNLADALSAVAEGGSPKGAPDSSPKGSNAPTPKECARSARCDGS